MGVVIGFVAGLCLGTGAVPLCLGAVIVGGTAAQYGTDYFAHKVWNAWDVSLWDSFVSTLVSVGATRLCAGSCYAKAFSVNGAGAGGEAATIAEAKWTGGLAQVFRNVVTSKSVGLRLSDEATKMLTITGVTKVLGIGAGKLDGC